MTAAALAVGRRIPAIPRWAWLGLIAVVTGILFVAFHGQDVLPHDNDAPTFRRINEIREWIDANRNSNIVLVLTLQTIRVTVSTTFEVINAVLHGLGWLGTSAIAAVLGAYVGGRRMAVLSGFAFLSFGVLGLWGRSIDTLALTLAAVLLSLVIGIPLGILAGRNDRFYSVIRPILDVMQIMPTFAYLAPFALLFLIGAPTAVIVTLIYAIPPVIRITALGIREVAPTSIEAANSLGSTSLQLLRKVQLPMARRTIVIGINQTIMMALSMVVITVLVDAPGLGKNIIKALQQNDVGLAFDAGIAVVIMAIFLDRLTSKASERLDPAKSSEGGFPVLRGARRIAVVAVPVVAIAVGLLALGGDTFPDAVRLSFRAPINAVTDWMSLNLFWATEALKNAVTFGLINPLQAFLTTSPWWLILGMLTALALVISGPRPALITAACLLALPQIQMWEHSMETLASVIVATVLTLALGLVLGIVSARSDRFSAGIRPILDAAQTLPAFVYLLPAVALFLPTRFTAIIAAIIYAVPPVIRLVELGIRGVPATVREAAISNGATSSQLLWKVELPMARGSLLVAANQGIILVLAMVVVGGLVGAGALGYDVVAGFARRDFFGEGLAAGIAIVLLGVMLDRITQSAGIRDTQTAVAGRHGGHG